MNINSGRYGYEQTDFGDEKSIFADAYHMHDGSNGFRLLRQE